MSVPVRKWTHSENKFVHGIMCSLRRATRSRVGCGEVARNDGLDAYPMEIEPEMV